MDIAKFDEAAAKLGGRFRANSLIRKRLRETIQAGLFKSSFSFEKMIDGILDEILSGQISIKQSETESVGKSKEK